jgi:hypothetical protein
MSDTPQSPTDNPVNDDATAAIDEWKPEPRTWTWSDLFAAPMLAFKPKCAIFSLITLALVGVIGWLSRLVGVDDSGSWQPLLMWLVVTIQATVFITGTSLVATFFKADLLDDEFLSLGEALKAWSGRIVPSVMVPVFMSAIAFGFWFLIWGGTAFSNIPFVGPVLYPFLYPLAFPLALMTVLITIAVLLALFVAPAIIAIRKHAWLDNVIDTFEAVGTKPHVLITNALVTTILVTVAFNIAGGAMGLLVQATEWGLTPGSATQEMQAVARPYTTELIEQTQEALPGIGGLFNSTVVAPYVGGGEVSGLHSFMGHVLGIFQSIALALIIGYCVNLWIAGGMMTYLFVREDDYWDDSDLEDFDKLAKELEEEARQAEAAAAAEAEKLLAEQAEAEKAAASDAEDATDAATATTNEGLAETVEEKILDEVSDQAQESADANDGETPESEAKKPADG